MTEEIPAQAQSPAPMDQDVTAGKAKGEVIFTAVIIIIIMFNT